MKIEKKIEKHKSNSKHKFSKLYFFIMIFIIILFAIYLFYQYSNLNEFDQYIYNLKQEIEEAKDLNEELINQNEYKNSEEYIEKLARDKLGMVKSDEIVFFDINK